MNIGDVVWLRTVEDLAAEYGTNMHNHILADIDILPGMQNYLGKLCTIREITESYITFCESGGYLFPKCVVKRITGEECTQYFDDAFIESCLA